MKTEPKQIKAKAGEGEWRNEAVECFDALADHWSRLWMLAGLLELSRNAPELDSEMIGEAGGLMVEELEKVNGLLKRLRKEIANGSHS